MRKTLVALCLLVSSRAGAQSGYNYYTQYTVGSSNWQLNNQISVGTNGDGSGAIWASNTAGGSDCVNDDTSSALTVRLRCGIHANSLEQ
jgi:hypothetical protein